MNQKTIDSIDLLRSHIYHRLKDYPDYAEMLDVFISGESESRFWVYNLTSESGTEPVIDYSLVNGGGWLNVSISVSRLEQDIQNIILNWFVSEEVAATLNQELHLLKERN